MTEYGLPPARPLAEVLDGLTMPLLVLEGGGRLMHANTAGRALLAAGRGFRLARRRLVPCNPDFVPAFERALAELGQTGPEAPPLTLPLGDGQPGRRMLVVLRGLRRFLDEPLHPVALHVQDMDALPPLPFAALAALFAITPAERRVLEALLAGENLVEAAQRLGIGKATARTHLQNLFGKTGVARQPALVRLVMASQPPVWMTEAGGA
jgi:DNA-binding CsgD family transcriptional regulator